VPHSLFGEFREEPIVGSSDGGPRRAAREQKLLSRSKPLLYFQMFGVRKLIRTNRPIIAARYLVFTLSRHARILPRANQRKVIGHL
jgi:hypothetical protein